MRGKRRRTAKGSGGRAGAAYQVVRRLFHILVSRQRCAKILPDSTCDSNNANPLAKAIRRLKPVNKPFRAATCVTSGADNHQMLLPQTVGPVERAMTIKMLNGCLIAWAAFYAEVCFESATTVSAYSKFLSEATLHTLRNLELVRHISPRPKLSDPAQGRCELKPRRDGRVRCSAWLADAYY